MSTGNEIIPSPDYISKYSWLKYALTEHIPIVAPIAFYICTGYLIDGILGTGMLQFRLLYPFLLAFTAFFSLLFFVIQFLRGHLCDYINPRAILGFLIIVSLLSPFASIFSSIKQSIPGMNSFCWDYDLMQIDYYIHFGNHPWIFMQSLLNNEPIMRFLDVSYMLWFAVLFCFCLWMAWSKRRLLRLKFFICASVMWMLLGSLLGTVFSSAGPCYYSRVVTNNHDPYQPLMSALLKIHETRPLWAIKNQLGVWTAYANKEWLPFGGISAMPSIHVAMVVLFALVGMEVNRWFGAVMVWYAVVIFIGSIVLGWHYAVDGYISILMVILIWHITNTVINKYIINRFTI